AHAKEDGGWKTEDELSEMDWKRLSMGGDTLVLRMGISTLSEVTEKLINSGRSPQPPTAVIRWGTTPEQRTVVGTLADIAQRAIGARITPPAITLVGEVVRLRETLSWFEERPLF